MMTGITAGEVWRRTNEELREQFNFTEADLEANRNREMSPHQLQKLKGRIREGEFYILSGIVLFIFLARLPFIFPATRNWLFLLIFIIPITAVFSGIAQRKRYSADFNNPLIKSVAGAAQRKRPIFVDRRSNPKPEALIIQNVRFKITYEQFLILVDGFQYTVYYLPTSKFILSIECDRDNRFSKKYKILDEGTPPSKNIIRPKPKI